MCNSSENLVLYALRVAIYGGRNEYVFGRNISAVILIVDKSIAAQWVGANGQAVLGVFKIACEAN